MTSSRNKPWEKHHTNPRGILGGTGVICWLLNYSAIPGCLEDVFGFVVLLFGPSCLWPMLRWWKSEEQCHYAAPLLHLLVLCFDSLLYYAISCSGHCFTECRESERIY